MQGPLLWCFNVWFEGVRFHPAQVVEGRIPGMSAVGLHILYFESWLEAHEWDLEYLDMRGPMHTLSALSIIAALF